MSDLRSELKSKLRGRVVVVGVGNAQHGDDAAGTQIARLLTRMGAANVLDGGTAPELETWRIRELVPETVLFADAVDFGGAPGDAALLATTDLRQSGHDTHRAPLRLVMRYLESELGCRCYLIAVQPGDVRPGSPMCEQVRQTVETLAAAISEALIR